MTVKKRKKNRRKYGGRILGEGGFVPLPPAYLAGREVLTLLSNLYFGLVRSHHQAVESADGTVEAPAAIYDGMITVEIPISTPQIVAYELPPNADTEIEIIRHISRA